MASTSRHIGSSDVPSSSSTCHWDVFLSFRGEDTRSNFTGHLYAALDRVGIQTFMDDPKLRKGEEISSGLLEAIQESRTSIVVFSENYASSTWCLDELVKILECKKTIGQSVLPVFFHVTPADVRRQKGSFAEAFEKHELRFVADMDKVDKWRATLTEAADLSGYHIGQHVDEAKIIKDIIAEVLLEVNPKYMNVAKHPVGIESRIKHINPLLSIGSGCVRKIGIYGMGGVGKTTIAKAVYNDIIHYFEGTCFIENVRESSNKENGLVGLQKQLAWDILKTDEKIRNVSEGMSLIEKRICSKKILIVLDDVDHIKQSDALVGKWNQFASGSRIIITTRDAGLLNQIRVDERYNTEELDNDESLLLFSWHAFKTPMPLENYMEISKDIVHYAVGLPLALEVLGSYLYTRTMEEWKGSLNKLKQIPLDEIQEKLIISFHALRGDKLKDIFLDIACFFIGMDRFEAIKILNSCGFDSENEIIILVERGLLSINDKNELRMHDLLRDMGREIVKKESPKVLGNRSRLWSYEDICNVLEKGKGTEAIEGIVPHTRSLHGVRLDTKTFERMHRLRLLNIDGVHVTGSFKHIFEELRWLSWRNCPLQCLPFDFKPEELRILDLEGSQVITLWRDILILQQLKILNLNNCQLLKKTPDFTGVASLQKLILSDCTNLVKVHKSIGCLNRLVYLDLSKCRKLRILPREVCNLRELTYLNINGCSNLEALPEEFGNLQCLKVLSVSGCEIKKIPDSIGQLSRLVNLDLACCSNLMYLPSSLCNLKALETLYVNYCSNLKRLPEELGNFESLRELRAGGTLIKELPYSIGFMKNLEILDVQSLTESKKDVKPIIHSVLISSATGFVPPSICGLCSLRKLNLKNCVLFDEDISENIGSLSSLEELDLSENYFCSLPSSLIRLSNLKVLALLNCRRLGSLSELPPNLERLDLKDCISMERLPNISNLKYLVELRLRNCRSLGEIQGLGNINAIQKLHLDGCSQLANIFDENFFKLYSGFGRKIDIHLSTREIPDWFNHQSLWPTMTIDVPPFKPNTFLGMILWLVSDHGVKKVRVKNQTNGATRTHFDVSFHFPSSSEVQSWVTFIPQTQLPVNKGDQIEVSFEANSTVFINAYSDKVERCGIHMVYEPDIVNDIEVNDPSFFPI